MLARNSATLEGLLVWQERRRGKESHVLFRCDDLPLYCLLVVRSSTCRTQAVHVILDIVEAELADLMATCQGRLEQ